MRKLLVFLHAMMFVTWCLAGDFRTWTVTTHTQTSSIAMTKYADPFVGEIDEISVYSPVGITGAVAVAAIDSFTSNALVLATNALVSGSMVWRPRIMPPAMTGATSLTVTNAVTDARFNACGENIRAIVSSASKTSATFRIYLKLK